MRSRYRVNGEVRPGLDRENMSPEDVFDVIIESVSKSDGFEIRYMKSDIAEDTSGVSILFIYESGVTASIEGTADEMSPYIELMSRMLRRLVPSPGRPIEEAMKSACDEIARRTMPSSFARNVGELFYPPWEVVRTQMILVLGGKVPFPM